MKNNCGRISFSINNSSFDTHPVIYSKRIFSLLEFFPFSKIRQCLLC